MIKIIKHGQIGFPENKKFKCDVCKCEWEADNNDYALFSVTETNMTGSVLYMYRSPCPNCGIDSYTSFRVDKGGKDIHEDS